MRTYKVIFATLTVALSLACIPARAQNFDNVLSSSPLGAIADLARIDPSNFLREVQGFVKVNNARDLAALGKQAAGVALHIEELQISFLQSSICKSGVIPAQYSREVQIGCDLLGAQAELNRIKQKALALVAP